MGCYKGVVRLATTMILLAALRLSLAVSTVRPSLLFSDNMVLLSSDTQPATVFGLASPGEVVRLTDSRPNSNDSHTTADGGGRWVIRLPPHVRAKGEPSFELELSGSGVGQIVVARNVAYGEVILCSGQVSKYTEYASRKDVSGPSLSPGPLEALMRRQNNTHHPTEKQDAGGKSFPLPSLSLFSSLLLRRHPPSLNPDLLPSPPHSPSWLTPPTHTTTNHQPSHTHTYAAATPTATTIHDHHYHHPARPCTATLEQHGHRLDCGVQRD